MTKKDYVLIAESIIKGYSLAIINNSDKWQALGLILASLEDRLKEDNPKFDPDKFTKYIYSRI